MPKNDSKGKTRQGSTSNYTPINPKDFEVHKKHTKINMILMIVAVVTALVLALIVITIIQSPSSQ